MSGNGALVILERNPIARSMLKTLLSTRTDEILFADDSDALQDVAKSASRILIDAASVADDVETILRHLTGLNEIVSEQRVKAFVLWREPDERVVAAVALLEGVSLIHKPIAGPALAARLFGGDDAPDQPLVTRAA